MTTFRAFLILGSALAVARAESSVQHLLEAKMHNRIKAVDDALPGALGVATIDLTSGRIYVYNGEAVFPTASAIKIPIMVQMFRAKVNLEERITLQPSDAVGGSGILQKPLSKGPVTLTVRELMTAMIEHSDNTATNRCIQIAGMERVNALITGLGLRSTRLRRVMMDSAAAKRGDENISTPVEMARLVEMLYRNKLSAPQDTRQMLDILKLVKADFRSTLPPEVEVASKPGAIPGVHCEAGVVLLKGRPFVLSVFSTFLNDDANPLPEVTGIVFEYFRKLAQSNEYGHRVNP